MALTHSQRVTANRAAHGLGPLPALKPPANTHPVNVPDPLADPDYKAEAAQLNNQKAQYATQNQHGLAQYARQYGQQAQSLGFVNHKWDTHDLTPGTYGAAMRDTSNDFVTRGMGYSSPYTTAMANMKSDYDGRITKLHTDLTDYQQTQRDQLATYNANNAAQLANSRRAAVGRIAGRLGLQPTQVIAGRTNRVNVPNA